MPATCKAPTGGTCIKPDSCKAFFLLLFDTGDDHVPLHLLIGQERRKILQGRRDQCAVLQPLGRGFWGKDLLPVHEHLTDHRPFHPKSFLDGRPQLAVVMGGHIGVAVGGGQLFHGREA